MQVPKLPKDGLLHTCPLLPVLQCLAGQGRGVFATEAVQPGTLLLVAPPLSVLYCDEGTTPENEDLAEHMLQVCWQHHVPAHMQNEHYQYDCNAVNACCVCS